MSVASPYAVFSMPKTPENFAAIDVQLAAGRVNNVSTELIELLCACRSTNEIDKFNDLVAQVSSTIHRFTLDK